MSVGSDRKGNQLIDSLKCLSRGFYLSPENFQAETCALCYIYMPPSQFKHKWIKATVKMVRFVIYNFKNQLFQKVKIRLNFYGINLSVFLYIPKWESSLEFCILVMKFLMELVKYMEM